MQIPNVDYLVLFLYFIFIVYVGLYKKNNKPKDFDQFVLSGRKLSLPGFIVTLVATWYGGILGQGENTFNNGIQTWVIFGLPYYVFAIIYAFVIPQRVLKLNSYSLSDHFLITYGAKAGIISALYVLVLASPAPYILSLGVLTSFITGISPQMSIILTTSFTFLYLWKGGFGAIIRTDILQFILMFLGFFLLLFFCLDHKPFSTMISELPKTFLNKESLGSLQYIFVWFFIAMWTFVDPGFYQRIIASGSIRVAKKGILISVVFWFIFDILTISTALYAKTLFPLSNPLFIYPELAYEVLPPLLSGLFITGLIATIMSTIDSLGFISGFTFGHDILMKIKEVKKTSKTNSNHSIQYIQKGLVVTCFISLILVFSFPSVVQLWYGIGSTMIPGLLLPFFLSFSKLKLNIVPSMIIPTLISSIWLFIGYIFGSYPFKIEPFYPGLLTSIIIILFTIIYEKRN